MLGLSPFKPPKIGSDMQFLHEDRCFCLVGFKGHVLVQSFDSSLNILRREEDDDNLHFNMRIVHIITGTAAQWLAR